MATILETARLLVRHMDPADLDALHAITGDPEVMRFVGDLKPLSRAGTQLMIETAIDDYRARGYGEYAVILREENVLAGYGGFAVRADSEHVELDYVLARAFWSRGLATELAAALVDHACDTLGLPELGASFDPANRASMRVAEKAGFTFSRRGLDTHGLPTVYFRRK